MKIVFQIGILLLFSTYSMAQKITIHGMLKDKSTEEPIPFGAVQFQGTGVGEATNAKGEYRFTLDAFPGDSLFARVMGYTIVTKAVDKEKTDQTIDFLLDRKEYELEEFVVSAGINPALHILKRIIRNKPKNNPNRFDNYKYKVYNKLEVDINNLDEEKFRSSKILKPFAFLLENIDSTSEERPFLPIFLIESMSDFYYQKEPKKEKEIITANRSSGLENKSFTEFVGSMYQDVNIYDNFIGILKKEFISPINTSATTYYDYQLIDTQYVDNRRLFHIAFKPKRRGGQTFFGDFWVNDSTYAIQRIDMQVDNAANINFINRLSLMQEYEPLNDSLWFPIKDIFVADFNVIGEKRIGFIGRKTTSYYDVAVNKEEITSFFEKEERKNEEVIVLPRSSEKSDSFWINNRYADLSENEKNIYWMMDTLKHMPLYRRYSDAIRFLAEGTLPVGPIEFGPYWNLFNINDREKFRLRYDMGTTTELFKDIYFHGYVAYGFGDRQFKGGLSGLFILKRKPRTSITATYTNDLDNNFHTNQINIGTDNILTVAVRKKGIKQKFLKEDKKRVEFYKEWFSGFSVNGSFENARYNPYAPLPGKAFFMKDGNAKSSLNNTEVGIGFRYAWREKFLEGDYFRLSLGSKYPILNVNAAFGVKNVFSSGYKYEKIGANISDNLPIPPLGRLKYHLYAGRIYGTLPFRLLEIHPGNELYYYNSFAFNLMNRYEYISDKWAGFNIEHNLGGGIFSRIPGVKKLKLRQFWTAKGVVGWLSEENRDFNENGIFPFKSLEGKPYLELGTGIENILHLIRIDFVWRVLPQPLTTEPVYKRFGVFGSFKIHF